MDLDGREKRACICEIASACTPLPLGGRMPNLRAIVSLKCLFPMSGVLGPFSAAKKKSVPLQFPRPLLYSVFFFFQQHTSAVEFPPLFGMREFGGGMGGVSFSRVYQAPESGSISDYTRGKSETSAAVDSGEVQSAHQFLLDSQTPLLSLTFSPSLSLCPFISLCLC